MFGSSDLKQTLSMVIGIAMRKLEKDGGFGALVFMVGPEPFYPIAPIPIPECWFGSDENKDTLFAALRETARNTEASAVVMLLSAMALVISKDLTEERRALLETMMEEPSTDKFTLGEFGEKHSAILASAQTPTTSILMQQFYKIEGDGKVKFGERKTLDSNEGITIAGRFAIWPVKV